MAKETKVNKTELKKPGPTTKTMTRQMRRRAVVSLVTMIGFCFSVLIAQLFNMQVLETDDWQKRAVAQQLSDIVISPIGDRSTMPI